MLYGLRDSDIVHITDAISQFDEISEVLLFGSRAKGNYKIESDVDLAIKGDQVTPTTVLELSDCLNEEKPLPYFFDVIQYETIDELRGLWNRVCKLMIKDANRSGSVMRNY